jgi:hypothetical protein
MEKVQAALQVDLVVAAQEYALTLSTFTPESMTDADDTSLVDRGTVISKALKKLTEDRTEIHRGFDELKSKTTRRMSDIIITLTAAKAEAGEIYTRRQRMKREAAERQQEQARLAAEAAATAAAEDSSSAPAPPPAEVPVEVPKNRTEGAVGTATGRKGPAKFKVLDWALVAQHYPHLLLLDEAKARVELRAAQIKDPAATLAGLEFWHPESVSFGAR